MARIVLNPPAYPHYPPNTGDGVEGGDGFKAVIDNINLMTTELYGGAANATVSASALVVVGTASAAQVTASAATVIGTASAAQVTASAATIIGTASAAQVTASAASIVGTASAAQTVVTTDIVTSASVATFALIGASTPAVVGFHAATPTSQRAGAAQATADATACVASAVGFGFLSSAVYNSWVTLINELRAAMVAKGLIKGAA